jgi:flagellar biosynthesis protein FlhB
MSNPQKTSATHPEKTESSRTSGAGLSIEKGCSSASNEVNVAVVMLESAFCYSASVHSVVVVRVQSFSPVYSHM